MYTYMYIYICNNNVNIYNAEIHISAYGPKTGPAFLRFFCVVICLGGWGGGVVTTGSGS